MSTSGEHTGNGIPIETSLKREPATQQIDSLLLHFDVLPSRFDRFLFKYIYVLLIGSFILGELLLIPIFLLDISSFPIGEFLLGSGIDVLITAAFISVVWRFNIWRSRTPKSLYDLVEKKRIYVPDGDVDTLYLGFLENYRDALARPKRYFLCSFLMILVIILNASIVQDISIGYPVGHPNLPLTLLVSINDLFYVLVSLAGVYCIGIVFWTMYISGWYIRKLVRVFNLRIQPFHTDKCGGLKVLGNFCFGLFSPILIGSGLLIGWILLILLTNSGGDGVRLALNVGSAVLVLLLYAFPASIFAFMLPLRDIHTKMVSEAEIDEETYIARIEGLREEIQSLLDTNQVEEAKVVQEKKAVMETLHTPYPTWPFSFRSKIVSTVLGTSGSILIGVTTAALQQYFLPVILPLIFHKP